MNPFKFKETLFEIDLISIQNTDTIVLHTKQKTKIVMLNSKTKKTLGKAAKIILF